jgi:DNA-sulfur modification-associated
MNSENSAGSGFVIQVPAYQKVAPVGGQVSHSNGRKTFVTMMKVSALKDLMPEVKVGAIPSETNREVNEKRVADLADYYKNNGDRVIIPPILADTYLDFEFQKGGELKVDNLNSIEVGILQVPLAVEEALIILDGQHRVAGLVKAYRETVAQLQNLHDQKERLLDQENDPLQREELRRISTQISTLEALLERFKRDTVTVEIRTNTPRDLHKEWFVTIADNAKGINKSERARLDTMNLSSLAAKKVCEKHPLLAGTIGESGQPRIDYRNNMAKRTSDTIYSLDNIRNVVKNIAFSAAKKETARLERAMLERIDSVENETMKFFDALVEKVSRFQELERITSGYTGVQFRKDSLYASPTMLRALAGAYHSLVIETKKTTKASAVADLPHDSEGYEKFKQLLSNLNEFMDLKTYNGEVDIHPKWRATTLFRESGLAPQSGFQDLAKLVELLTDWGRSGQVFTGSVYNSIKKAGA